MFRTNKQGIIKSRHTYETELRVAKPKLKLLSTPLLWSIFAYYRVTKKWLTRPPRVDIYNFFYFTQRAWDGKKILKNRELLQIICKIYRNFVVCGSLKRIPPKSLTVINAALQAKLNFNLLINPPADGAKRRARVLIPPAIYTRGNERISGV
jgi:hypothetical protein